MEPRMYNPYSVEKFRFDEIVIFFLYSSGQNFLTNKEMREHFTNLVRSIYISTRGFVS